MIIVKYAILISLFFPLAALDGIHSIEGIDSAKQLPYPELEDRLVRLDIIEENGQAIPNGTGFILNDSTILTCAHAVAKFDEKDTSYREGRYLIESYVAKFREAHKAEEVKLFSPTKQKLNIREIYIHPKFQRFYDIAIIRIDPIQLGNLKEILITHKEESAIGDTILSFGYGLMYQVNKINPIDSSGLQLNGGRNIIFNRYERAGCQYAQSLFNTPEDENYLVDECNPAPGDSGAPLFKEKGKKLYLIGLCNQALMNNMLNPDFYQKKYYGSKGVYLLLTRELKQWINSLP